MPQYLIERGDEGIFNLAVGQVRVLGSKGILPKVGHLPRRRHQSTDKGTADDYQTSTQTASDFRIDIGR
mgnify:CR=1 FL=1